MEHTKLVGSECADDRMQHATVMEEHEVLLMPVVRVHQLQDGVSGTSLREPVSQTLGAMAGRCILYSRSRTSLRSLT